MNFTMITQPVCSVDQAWSNPEPHLNWMSQSTGWRWNKAVREIAKWTDFQWVKANKHQAVTT